MSIMREVMIACALVATSAVCAAATSPASRTFEVTAARDSNTATFSTSTVTTSTFPPGCGGVERCLDDPQCAQCLTAANATVGFPHTVPEYFALDRAASRAYEVGFFQALQSTASCSTTSTSPGIFYPALFELYDVASCLAYRMDVGACLLHEYTCFVDSDCRQCLAALFDAAATDGANGTKAEAFRSPACTAANLELLDTLETNCGAFPRCAFYKHHCASLPECALCLSTLGAGNGAEAARQCPGSTQPSARAIDDVVQNCITSSAVACSFWRQRCNSNADCGVCLASLGSGGSAAAIATEWSTPACSRASQNDVTMNYLHLLTRGCPGISTCRLVITACVDFAGETCIACLNGSAPPSQAAVCASLISQQDFAIDTACQLCPESVHTINAIVFATAMVGGASAAACLAVAMAIVAHSRDRVSMRDRIVVGLMLTNALYSTANTIPLNALHSGIVDCGHLAMSFEAIRFGRALWFCGKYGLVSFELFIMLASIQALQRGISAVSRRAEAAMHTVCWCLAVTAFAVFCALCARIDTDGYAVSMENEAYTNAYNHAGANDDLDDDVPSVAASVSFENGRREYDALVRDMLVAWDALVGLAVVLWIVLRVMHHHALRILRSEVVAASEAQARDVWAGTRRSGWEAKHRLLEAHRNAFNEVAKPLEPYIAVFVLFAAPAFVMSTTFCTNHSGAIATGGTGSVSSAGVSTDFTFETCDVWCEFVLAFRSLAVVAVYLVSRERRAELVAVRSTCRKLSVRAAKCIMCASPTHSLLDHDDEIELHTLARQSYNVGVNNAIVAAAAAAPTDSPWHIYECDIAVVRVLGKGAYGEVWEGRFKSDGSKVAIKVMLSSADDDENGDTADFKANKDFHKECESLRRIDSPHLIKFYGFGTTASGNGFIVTELMSGGSLEDVLHNKDRDLPWRTRVAIALQVALGMNHLHERHMLHRDLKSANVLLDEEHLKAKVCDFGLARVVRPARRHDIVRSPFTGVTRRLPSVDSVTMCDDGRPVLSMARIAVTFSDVRGTMTKAAGTLLWMAPEVFRGDRTYTGAIDVYSFGILLWEVATRETPWADELHSVQSDLAFFEGLNHALQSGHRPTIPDTVVEQHGSFVSVMQRCWAGDPVDRPSFSEAAHDLAAILNCEAK